MIRNRWELVVLVAVVATAAVPLSALLGLEFLTPIIAILGFVVALPLALVFGDRILADDGDDTTTAADPLEQLRDRYARGEIGHDEFERRMERLVETEEFDPHEGEAVDLERELE